VQAAQDAEYARLVHEEEEQANRGGTSTPPVSDLPSASELGLSEEEYQQVLAAAQGGPGARAHPSEGGSGGTSGTRFGLLRSSEALSALELGAEVKDTGGPAVSREDQAAWEEMEGNRIKVKIATLQRCAFPYVHADSKGVVAWMVSSHRMALIVCTPGSGRSCCEQWACYATWLMSTAA
jgi:hypothetical protein